MVEKQPISPENSSKKFCLKTALPLSLPSQKGEFSSAGLEHLPYKQRVGGSIPSTPTTKKTTYIYKVGGFFYSPGITPGYYFTKFGKRFNEDCPHIESFGNTLNF